jgi:hypothetical protein
MVDELAEVREAGADAAVFLVVLLVGRGDVRVGRHGFRERVQFVRRELGRRKCPEHAPEAALELWGLRVPVGAADLAVVVVVNVGVRRGRWHGVPLQELESSLRGDHQPVLRRISRGTCRRKIGKRHDRHRPESGCAFMP